MQAINDNKAVQFLENLQGDRARSAVIAIHVAWLRNSPGVCAETPLDTTDPLDMEILYQAAASTFQNWPPPIAQGMRLPSGGRVRNRDMALERLRRVADEETRRLASIFAGHVVALSSMATADQDLDYYVELMLKCIGDKSVIANIVSGAISTHSEGLADPDLW